MSELFHKKMVNEKLKESTLTPTHIQCVFNKDKHQGLDRGQALALSYLVLPTTFIVW